MNSHLTTAEKLTALDKSRQMCAEITAEILCLEQQLAIWYRRLRHYEQLLPALVEAEQVAGQAWRSNDDG